MNICTYVHTFIYYQREKTVENTRKMKCVWCFITRKDGENVEKRKGRVNKGFLNENTRKKANSTESRVRFSFA